MPEQKVSKIPKAAKRPADHKKPDQDDELYEFTWEGTTYRLPLVTDGMEKVSGRRLRDAVMGGDEGQLRLGFSILESLDNLEPGTLDALYDMPAPEMLEHLKGWMERVREGQATVGESLRSLS